MVLFLFFFFKKGAFSGKYEYFFIKIVWPGGICGVLTGSERNRPQNDEKGSFFDFSNEYGFLGG